MPVRYHTLVQGHCIPNGISERKTLIDYLGGAMVAGDKLKDTVTTNWSIPNKDATSESGFNGLPVSYRAGFRVFDHVGN